MENVTNSDVFINAYLKKQEDFTVELIRKKLETEVKVQLLQTELQKVLTEKIPLEDMVKQSMTGLEGITLERDKYKNKVTELENKLEKDIRALRDINVDNQTLITELKEQIKQSTTLKSDYETLKNNYNKVNEELNRVNGELNRVLQELTKANEELTKANEKPIDKPAVINKKKLKKDLQESEWIDGNEIST
jgi:chromosome segregation ATPase